MERDCHIKNVLIWGTSCKQNVEKFSSLWGICCKQNIENILMWSISCKQNVQKVSAVMLFQLKNSFCKILWFSNFIVVSHSVLITEDNIPGGHAGSFIKGLFNRTLASALFSSQKFQCVQSYEKPGWLSYWDLGNRDGNFPVWTHQSDWPEQNYFNKIASLPHHSGKIDIIILLYVYTLEVCRLIL